MQAGDRVYYLYTGKLGTRVKFAAVVLDVTAEGVSIRVGRYDVERREVDTFESTVQADSLQPRSVPCSFEDQLQDGN
jgi:hypothetical protein